MKYSDALMEAIKGWNNDPIDDEWLFEKFRRNFIEAMSTEEAFLAITETIEALMQESDEFTAIEILNTIISLARRSETTEVPSYLLFSKKVIDDKFFLFGGYAKNQLKELWHYYRIS